MGTRWNRLCEAVLTNTTIYVFEQSFSSENFIAFGCKIFYIFEYACFRNDYYYYYKTCLFKYILKILQPKQTNIRIKNSDIFNSSAQNIDCGYSLETPLRGGSNEYPQ